METLIKIQITGTKRELRITIFTKKLILKIVYVKKKNKVVSKLSKTKIKTKIELRAD